MRYTNKQHLRKTKRLKYQRLLNNVKIKKGIIDIEKDLSEYNSKSCIYDTFKEYVRKKNEVNVKLLELYKDDIFRKYKWYGYINRKRAETDLVRQIIDTFGRNITIVYGDWSSGYQMKHMISTPNLGLKRKLGEYFTIYNIDEFRTSKLHYKTHKKCENIHLPDNTLDKKRSYQKNTSNSNISNGKY